MKKFLACCAVFAVTATSAFAGNKMAPSPEPYVPLPAAPAPAFNWTGGYIGGHVGAVRGRHQMRFPGAGLASDPNPTGFMGGLFAGYNWHGSGQFVFGVEAEVNIARASGTDVLRVVSTGNTNPNEVWRSRIDRSAALRLRVGWAHDQTLFYVAGGPSVARQTFSVDDFGVTRFTERRNVSGWTIGLGLERAIYDGWSLRGELRHTDYGRVDYTVNTLPGTIPATSRLRSTDLLVGLSRRF